MRPGLAILWTILSLAPALFAQDEDFHIYRDSPRILLTPERLRFLQRERERQSLRWEPFEAMIRAGNELPERGFALALYYRVSKDDAIGRKAVEWALGGATDLRQLALVFDWCGPLMTDAQNSQLANKLERGIASAASAAGIREQSARALAAVALADRLPDQGNSILRDVVQTWRKQPSVPREQIYYLYELLHVIRDNTKIDLRESARVYFDELPMAHIAAHYPAPFPGLLNLCRIPIYLRDGDPDLADAIHSRAAALEMVAYDTNAPSSQFLQGWLMQDQFLMRDSLGLPYEFLWANPYQPGLNQDSLSLAFRSKTGDVFSRSSWKDDATWAGYFDGRLQIFQDGRVQTLKAGAEFAPLQVGPVTFAVSSKEIAFNITSLLVYFGFGARTEYDVQIEGQPAQVVQSDGFGTLVITGKIGISGRVKVQKKILR